MTPEEMAHVEQRRQKIRDAIKNLEQREQSKKVEEATLLELINRLEVLQSKIAAKPTGRPPTWKGPAGCETVEIVEAMRRQGSSIADALRRLRSGPPWAEWWADRSEEELQTRYHEALKYWEPLFNELREIEDAIAENRVDDSPLPDVKRLVREG
jgi:hypothetical protein